MVPGKLPLYLEGDEPEIGAESAANVGIELQCDGARLVFVPGAAAVTPCHARTLRARRRHPVRRHAVRRRRDAAHRHRTENRPPHGPHADRRRGRHACRRSPGLPRGAFSSISTTPIRSRSTARPNAAKSRPPAGRWPRTAWRSCCETALARRTGSGAARHRRAALSPPASVPRPAARRQMQQRPGAGLGAQSLLLSGDDPDQGREPDRALRGFRRAPRMALAPGRSRRRARRRRRHRALAQAHRRPRARPRLRHLAARAVARHALCGRGLCALRAREDAAGSDRLVAHRNVLARHHRRAHGRDAGELRFRHPRDA